jgi:uncharacterized protein (TIGR03437 family)
MPRISATLALATLLAALTTPATAQTSVTVLHRFEAPACSPNGNLLLTSDGALYGTTFASLPSGFSNGGSVFRIPAAGGSLTTLAQFPTTLINDNTTNSLTAGPDGNFYGLRADTRTSRPRIFYRLSPTGTLTTIFEFSDLQGIPTSSLVLGADGAFYGAATNVTFRPHGLLSTIFRLTTTGDYSVVYPTAEIFAQNPIRLPPELQLGPAEHLIRTANGTFYGAFARNTSPTVFSLAPGGAPRNLLNASPTVAPSEVVGLGTLSPGLTLAGDGNLYMAGVYSRGTRSPVIFRITPAGVASILYTWPANILQRTQTIAPLIQGSDGNLYGASLDGGLQSAGFFYRLTLAGEYTVLHEFNQENGFYFEGRMVQGPDGAFYLPASRRTSPNTSGFLCGAIVKIDAGLSPRPVISTNGVVTNGTSLNTVQPGAWVSIFGSNLATGTNVWNGDFPTSLGGASVTINNKPAYLWFVGPGQINLQAPDDDATGSVPVVVTTPAGTATANVTLSRFSPAFSLLDGRRVAGIIPRNGSGAHGGGAYDIVGPTGDALGYRTVAARPGDSVILFGIGFGPTTPAVPAGRPFAGSAPTSGPVTLRINGNIVPLGYAGLTSAGLYQFNFTLPAGLGTGEVALSATVGGVTTPGGVVISIQ